MIELELLGLSDGQKLSLNDSEGNRYVLPITDELRAALRTDLHGEDEEPRPMTPREIQAHFRAGLTVTEVSEISSLPPSQLTGLASPIFAEREYTAQLARAHRIGHDAGAMTLEELVVSRLVSRNVDSSSITWDSYRDKGEPWTLVARYISGDREHTALWSVDTKAQTVQARNDEATWLTESQIPAPSTPWRRPNTPTVSDGERPESRGATGADREVLDDAQRNLAAGKISAMDARPASSSNSVDIDSMLASLNSRRGTSQPMPDEPEFDGAHPADSEPDKALDATILAFPGRTDSAPQTEAESQEGLAQPSAGPDGDSDSAEPLPGQEELPGVAHDARAATQNLAPQPKPRKKRRRDRPTMPSWDEIVFGYSKDN